MFWWNDASGAVICKGKLSSVHLEDFSRSNGVTPAGRNNCHDCISTADEALNTKPSVVK